MGVGRTASMRESERIRFGEEEEVVQGFFKTFGRFCLRDNYILPAGFCKTTSFVAATTV